MTPIISRSHVVWLPEFQGSGAKRERNANTHFAIYSHQKSQTFRNRLSWRKAVRFFNAARSAHTNVFFCFSSVFAKCCKLFLLLHECDITFYVPKQYDVVLGPSDFSGMWCWKMAFQIAYNLKDKEFSGCNDKMYRTQSSFKVKLKVISKWSRETLISFSK